MKKLWNMLIDPLRRFARWWVFHSPKVPFGLAPYLLGFGVGSKGIRVIKTEQKGKRDE